MAVIRCTHLVTMLLTAAALGACAGDPPPPTPAASGRALPRLPGGSALGRPALAVAEVPPDASLRIMHEPATLQVYRSTRVRLWVERPPEHSAATCRWSFVDGEDEVARAADDCSIEHTFIGGAADERVSVVLTDGAWSQTVTRILPLERLPVSSRPVEPEAAGSLPEKPSQDQGFRMVLIADTVDATSARLAALARRIVAIDADVVVHLGGHAADGQQWTTLRETLAEGLRAADIPLLSGISPADLELGPEVRRPLGRGGEQLQLPDGEHFPERWTFSYEGVFLVFMSGAEQSPAALDWLRDRLTEGQVYGSRIVLSYLPLHPFGERVPAGPGAHTLGPKFKVYEILLRARTTALFSAGHHVYFRGRYGALPVVSVASASAGGQRLLGSDPTQPPSITVMDVEHGLPRRVFALVDGPDDAPFSTMLDEGYLPDTVEVYTR